MLFPIKHEKYRKTHVEVFIHFTILYLKVGFSNEGILQACDVTLYNDCGSLNTNHDGLYAGNHVANGKMAYTFLRVLSTIYSIIEIIAKVEVF